MTGHDDFDRTVAGWFEADSISPAPAEDLDRVLDATRRRRPRPAWLSGLGSHWVGEAYGAGAGSGEATLTRLGLRWSTVIVLLLVIAALVGGAILVGARLFQPSPLPTGHLGRLAYVLDGDIYLADWDGSNPVRIADGVPDNAPPTCGSYGGEGSMWSPDGRHLAYRFGNFDCADQTVRISDADGHQVASFPGHGWLVSWSPDSSRVATWVELGNTIGVYGLDGVRQALFTLPSGFGAYRDEDPIWSPDGASLLISLRPEPGFGGTRQTWELPIDGRTPGPVPEGDPRSHFEAAYSRDGARMAFVDDSDSVSLVIAKADGTKLRVLEGAKEDPIYGLYGPGASGAIYDSPVLSPTGDRVAFSWSPAIDAPESSSEIRVADVATGNLTTLAHSTDDYPSLGSAIRFSPEGDRVLFSRTDASGVTSLWSIRVDGSDARLLVSGAEWGDWQWQPAGSTVMPSAPAPTPSTTIAPSAPAATPSGDALRTFVIGSPLSGHPVTLKLPSGWRSDGRFIVKDLGLPGEVGVGAWLIGGIYPDPCHWQGTPAVPVAGSSEIVSDLLHQKGRNASSLVSDIHRGPWSERPIELSVPADLDIATCDQGTYKSWSDRGDTAFGNNNQPAAGNDNHRAGQIDVVYIDDVDRGPVVIDAWHFPGTSAASLAELEAALQAIIVE
jgi:Tol biopolymer transport system component